MYNNGLNNNENAVTLSQYLLNTDRLHQSIDKITPMKKIFCFIALCLVTFIACDSDNDDNNTNNGKARIEVRLTDAPAPYDEVNIDIIGISLHVTNEDFSGWEELTLLYPGIYNLLDYRNGVDTLLAAYDIPAGKISQVRLLLGENNTIVKEGAEYPLKTPSAQQSGLKLNFHDELIAGVLYKLWIDFDASRSIVETGSGKFQLKPVIRAYAEAISMTGIAGSVTPVEGYNRIDAILGTDTLTSYPNLKGEYVFLGLTPANTWKLKGYSTDEILYPDIVVENITVREGEVTRQDLVLP